MERVSENHRVWNQKNGNMCVVKDLSRIKYVLSCHRSILKQFQAMYEYYG